MFSLLELGERAMIVIGESNGGGFHLVMQDLRNLKVTEFTTPGYADGKERAEEDFRRLPPMLTGMARPLVFTWGLFAAVLAAPWRPTLLENLSVMVGCFLFAGVARTAFTHLATLVIPADAGWRRWHSCEHRMVLLVNRGILPDVRSMVAGRHLSIYCGSSHAWQDVEWNLILALACWYGWPALLLIPIIAAKAALYIRGSLGQLGVTPLSVALMMLAMPGYVLPLALERVAALRNPSMFQIRHSVRAFRAFLREHPEIAERLTK